MALLDKLNHIAKNIGDKTSDAIELTKLNSKLNTEKGIFSDLMKDLGEVCYDCYKEGGSLSPETEELCEKAGEQEQVIEAVQAEIARIRSESEKEEPVPEEPDCVSISPDTILCPLCHFVNPGENLFCQQCGKKLETVPEPRICASCGSQLPDEARFCGKCGAKAE